tara:strand:+ start:556 stop:1257 length:702 start_codon:yes stop_codon:yes gene_type:complete
MTPYTFDLFGNDHILSIILIIIFYVLFLCFNEKIGIKNKSEIFPIVLSFIILSLDISEDIIRYITGYYSIEKDLPLQLCAIGIYVAVVALLKKNQIAFELIFYWGLVGASQAILTPDSDLFELKIFFIYSQAYHSALIFAVLWLVIKCNMRMQIEYIPRVVLITNLVVVVISVINYLLDSNYMFLRVKPNSVSPFLIGDWPVYIIMVQFFSIVIVFLFIKIQDLLFLQVSSKQ